MPNILRILSTTKHYGGDIFEDELQDILETAGNSVVAFNPVPSGGSRIQKIPRYLKNLTQISDQAKNCDFIIRAMNHVFFMASIPKQLVIAYHYDTAYCHPLVKAHHILTLQSLVANKNKLHKLIVISKFWQDYFFNLGFKNIEIVYCGFDKKDFLVDSMSMQSLRSKINPGDKKIVYIGNSQRKKGADQVYEVLNDRNDILLVTSGNKDIDLPCLNLNLNRQEYLALLKLSSAVITFSQFKEGWNRVAHEAMMLGVPVIGSGFGGMGELLNGGGQKVVTRRAELNSALNAVLVDSEIGARGKEFAETFTKEKFRDSCLGLLR